MLPRLVLASFLVAVSANIPLETITEKELSNLIENEKNVIVLFSKVLNIHEMPHAWAFLHLPNLLSSSAFFADHCCSYLKKNCMIGVLIKV